LRLSSRVHADLLSKANLQTDIVQVHNKFYPEAEVQINLSELCSCSRVLLNFKLGNHGEQRGTHWSRMYLLLQWNVDKLLFQNNNI